MHPQILRLIEEQEEEKGVNAVLLFPFLSFVCLFVRWFVRSSVSPIFQLFVVLAVH